MKKYLSLLVVLSLVVVLVGCNKSDSKNGSTTGKSVRLEFSSNSSAGETPYIEESPEGIVSIKSESDQSKCEGRAGCSFSTYYTITGVKEGKTTVTFINKHVHGNILRKVVYNITVDKDLNITETHTEENNE